MRPQSAYGMVLTEVRVNLPRGIVIRTRGRSTLPYPI